MATSTGCTQFKEKSGRAARTRFGGAVSISGAEAADVLAYNADEVPVGEDQRQHIELMREVARRFNERFAPSEDRPIFVVPEVRVPEVGGRIMDLQDPTMKMSTTAGSDQGRILVLDEEKPCARR